jgi:hypothetical protein
MREEIKKIKNKNKKAGRMFCPALCCFVGKQAIVRAYAIRR